MRLDRQVNSQGVVGSEATCKDVYLCENDLYCITSQLTLISFLISQIKSLYILSLVIIVFVGSRDFDTGSGG